MGEIKKINLGNPPSFFYSPTWSPDSKKVAFTDKRLNLWYVDIDKGTPVKVDTNTYENPFRVLDPAWSPDSKWIGYTKQLRNRLCALFVYSIDTSKSTQITDGMSDARFAAFDKNGKYLYFTASTDTGPTTAWLDMSSMPFQTTRSVYLVVLKKGEKSPLSPESDEEKVAEEKKADSPAAPAAAPAGGGATPPKPPEKKEPPVVTIDFEDISQRILALPIPARNYIALSAAKSGLIFIAEAVVGGAPGATVHKFDLEKRKLDKVLEGVGSFEVSANGEKALYRLGPALDDCGCCDDLPAPASGLASCAERAQGRRNGSLDNPKAEWKQMYEEAWRIQRDFLYDPGLHGLTTRPRSRCTSPISQRSRTVPISHIYSMKC